MDIRATETVHYYQILYDGTSRTRKTEYKRLALIALKHKIPKIEENNYETLSSPLQITHNKELKPRAGLLLGLVVKCLGYQV